MFSTECSSLLFVLGHLLSYARKCLLSRLAVQLVIMWFLLRMKLVSCCALVLSSTSMAGRMTAPHES